MSVAVGVRLGVYEVVSHIGSGGMGEVYRARDTKLGRDVALKILPDSVGHDPERAARFGSNSHHPFWSRDGQELYYIPGPGQFAFVTITTRPTFTFSDPVQLSRGQVSFSEGGPVNTRQNDSTPDRCVVAVIPAGQTQTGNALTPQLQVVINWFEELKQRVPAR
jgi:serine/threonine protein kinase